MAHYDPLVINRAEGAWLTTADGRQLLDGVASLWCNVHGHARQEINEAIKEQLSRVAHVTTLGMSCDTTESLADELAKRTPGDLSHVFFSSDGSSAVEAAVKMAFQFWQQRAQPKVQKTKYLALNLAYHGDTTGAVSLGGIEYFHQLFSPILFATAVNVSADLPTLTKHCVGARNSSFRLFAIVPTSSENSLRTLLGERFALPTRSTRAQRQPKEAN